MAQPFTSKYTAEQWAAVYDARFARGVTYARIAELAEAGELTPGEPFELDAAYIGEKCRAEARKRQGKGPSPAASMPPADAVEYMRRRMLALFEAEVNKQELIKPEKRDLGRMTQLAKLATEIARIPGPKDPRPEKAAGSNTAGMPRTPDAPTSGPVGALLASFREQARNDNGPADGEPVQSDAVAG